MEIAQIKVSGTSVTVIKKSVIPAGIIGATVRIEYADPLWDGLAKTVVFDGVCTKDVADPGTVVTVPAEAVSQPGFRLCVGIYGVDANNTTAIPTLWADLGMIRNATDPSGDPATAPSLLIWEQILAWIGDMSKLSTAARESLVAAINELADNSGAAIDNEKLQEAVVDIVSAYMEEHPFEESDPTVPTKVSAFENDVGYLTEHQDLSEYAKNESIPKTLPNPHALTFTGAVSATYDGSEAVSVKIPEGGSGGSESEWRLINTITITEETNLIDITTDSDGNSFELSEVFINFDDTPYATAAATFYFRPNSKATNNMACYGFIGTAAGSNAQRYLHAKHIADGFWRAEFIKNDGHLTPLMTRPGETITSFSFYGQTFAAGTIYAYGR